MHALPRACSASTHAAGITAAPVQVFSTPVVLVSLVDSERQWFKSVVGLPGVTETDRESSFCAWTLLPQVPECLVVTDARNDARFRSNRLVTGPPYIQFYAGCPLLSSNGTRLGSLCTIDMRTRYFTAEDCNVLSNLAEVTVRELEAHNASKLCTFGSESERGEPLRGAAAWDVGILILHVSVLPHPARCIAAYAAHAPAYASASAPAWQRCMAAYAPAATRLLTALHARRGQAVAHSARKRTHG
jgi:hypothetical protein